MSYTIKYTGKTYHVAGIEEATKASADGMDYAVSACPTLSRMGFRMAIGGSGDDLAAILKTAQAKASNRNGKVCAKCQAAADRLLAA